MNYSRGGTSVLSLGAMALSPCYRGAKAVRWLRQFPVLFHDFLILSLHQSRRSRWALLCRSDQNVVKSGRPNARHHQPRLRRHGSSFETRYAHWTSGVALQRPVCRSLRPSGGIAPLAFVHVVRDPNSQCFVCSNIRGCRSAS
jgi:hypothetical protein